MSKKKGLKKTKPEYIKLPALHQTTVATVSSLLVNTEKHLAWKGWYFIIYNKAKVSMNIDWTETQQMCKWEVFH